MHNEYVVVFLCLNMLHLLSASEWIPLAELFQEEEMFLLLLKSFLSWKKEDVSVGILAVYCCHSYLLAFFVSGSPTSVRQSCY